MYSEVINRQKMYFKILAILNNITIEQNTVVKYETNCNFIFYFPNYKLLFEL